MPGIGPQHRYLHSCDRRHIHWHRYAHRRDTTNPGLWLPTRLVISFGKLWFASDEGRHRVLQVSHPADVSESDRLTLDDAALIREAAPAGYGVAYMSEWDVADDLHAGRLLQVLDDWTPPFPGMCLYYPGRRHVPAGLRAFIDLIQERRRHP